MRSIKVCRNCREPLTGKQKKFCARCAPHMTRVRGYMRANTKTWKHVSKRCSVCKKVKAIKEFPTHRKRSVNDIIYNFRRSQCIPCASTMKQRHTRAREAREKMLEHTLTNEEWQETLETLEHKCVYCGAPWEHQDHFIPLSRGGGYTVNNILPACSPCNVAKADKTPFDFIKYIRIVNHVMKEYAPVWDALANK